MNEAEAEARAYFSTGQVPKRIRTPQHDEHCDGCRELAVVTVLNDIERLCLDGYAFENVGRKVVTVDDVMAIIGRLPKPYRLT